MKHYKYWNNKIKTFLSCLRMLRLFFDGKQSTRNTIWQILFTLQNKWRQRIVTNLITPIKNPFVSIKSFLHFKIYVNVLPKFLTTHFFIKYKTASSIKTKYDCQIIYCYPVTDYIHHNRNMNLSKAVCDDRWVRMIKARKRRVEHMNCITSKRTFGTHWSNILHIIMYNLEFLWKVKYDIIIT